MLEGIQVKCVWRRISFGLGPRPVTVGTYISITRPKLSSVVAWAFPSRALKPQTGPEAETPGKTITYNIRKYIHTDIPPMYVRTYLSTYIHADIHVQVYIYVYTCLCTNNVICNVVWYSILSVRYCNMTQYVFKVRKCSTIYYNARSYTITYHNILEHHIAQYSVGQSGLTQSNPDISWCNIL